MASDAQIRQADAQAPPAVRSHHPVGQHHRPPRIGDRTGVHPRVGTSDVDTGPGAASRGVRARQAKGVVDPGRAVEDGQTVRDGDCPCQPERHRGIVDEGHPEGHQGHHRRQPGHGVGWSRPWWCCRCQYQWRQQFVDQPRPPGDPPKGDGGHHDVNAAQLHGRGGLPPVQQL